MDSQGHIIKKPQ